MRAVLSKASSSTWNIQESKRLFSSVFKTSCPENSKGKTDILGVPLCTAKFLTVISINSVDAVDLAFINAGLNVIDFYVSLHDFLQTLENMVSTGVRDTHN